MKKIMFLIFLMSALVVSLSFTACEEDSSEKKGAIVCLGDSLTAGFGASMPFADDKTKSYPAYLQKKVKNTVVNAGVTGNTTAQALARTDADVLSENPKIVVILLGANDIFLSINLETTKTNLQTIINKIDDGERQIYLAKFYTYAIAQQLVIMYPDIDIDAYNTMFTALAASENVTIIEDIWDGVWGINMSDTIHPNAKGYELMANNIFKAMEPYLKANGFTK